jgi:hypothetical protein
MSATLPFCFLIHSAVLRLEKLLAILLIALSLFLTGRMAVAMATHSLSTDEFGTVGSFSSKGPVHVMTDYRAPKNHIFFNLLNSILPGQESFAPARVRALSIASTLLTAAVLIAWAAWRSRLLEIAALLALWSTAPQMLPLSMEARGYGFLGLFAVTASLAAVEYLRAPDRRWLWTLGASVALGTWTVPGFLFFAGPLMLLLWAVNRTRATFLAGAFTFAAILILYAPVLTQLIAAFTGFHKDKDEADFVTIDAILRAAKLYLFQADNWESWTLFLLLALAPFAVRIDPKDAPAALRILAAASLVYFAILLALRTPPIRVAAFAFLPLGLAGFLAIGSWLRNTAPPLLRISATTLAGIFLLSQLASAARAFNFTPTEDWSFAGLAIDAAFPESTRVEFKRYAKYLQKTLADPDARQSDFDPAAFANGKLIVADAANKWAEASRFAPPEGMTRVVQWTIPGTIRDIVLTLRLPDSSGLDNPPAALADGRIDTGIALDKAILRATSTPSARAMIVLLNRAANADDVQGPPGMLVAGNAIVVPLQAGEIRFHSRKPGLSAVEAWLTQ